LLWECYLCWSLFQSKDWEPIDGTQVKRVIKMRADRDESDPLR
jgi:hypothetical protein